MRMEAPAYGVPLLPNDCCEEDSDDASPFPFGTIIGAENDGGGGCCDACWKFVFLELEASVWKLMLGVFELGVDANVMGISVCTPLLET